MALPKRRMQEIIRLNGHLVLDGDETTEDLKTALMYLTDHPSTMCRWPEYAIQIERLIPDPTVLLSKKLGPKGKPKSKPRNIVNVDISVDDL